MLMPCLQRFEWAVCMRLRWVVIVSFVCAHNLSSCLMGIAPRLRPTAIQYLSSEFQHIGMQHVDDCEPMQTMSAGVGRQPCQEAEGPEARGAGPLTLPAHPVQGPGQQA